MLKVRVSRRCTKELTTGYDGYLKRESRGMVDVQKKGVGNKRACMRLLVWITHKAFT